MRRFLSALLVVLLLCLNVPSGFAAQEVKKAGVKTNTAAPPAKVGQSIKFAFVLDGPSDKNTQLLKTFKETISKSIQPEYNAVFPDNLVFIGNWNYDNVKAVSEKALNSDCTVVISLGALSTKYLNEKKDKKKLVVTLDQYGLRDLGEGFFNPIQQYLNDIIVLQKLTKFNKVAILINENFYNNRKDWNEVISKRFAEKGLKAEFKAISTGNNISKNLAAINGDVDAVFITPLFNLSIQERKELFDGINAKKIPSFSSLGKEDVELGVLYGSGNSDMDRKLAKATSFNIYGVLKGDKQKFEQLQFYEDKLLYVNTDTADEMDIQVHLRLLNNAEIISKKPIPQFNLTAVFDELDKNNLDIERKRLLVKAAKNASLSAKLRYLPTFGVNLGYQRYNEDFAESAKLTTPEKTGIFSIGLDQVIYSPALVTNILLQRKKVDFSKAEQFLTEQNMGIEVALLYIDTLILENMIKTQEEYVKESRENLAIARTRANLGYCGSEEVMRWASQLSINEQHLLEMTAEYKNVKVQISKMLHHAQNENFSLAALRADDPAFYTKDIHIIDYVITPQNLEKFTQMLIQESLRTAPELVKLKAAMKMKDYEKNMYIQKFILPDAKLQLDYTSLFGREFTSPVYLGPYVGTIPPAKPNFGRIGVFAQWKPIEGGTKFAEIARIKNERAELQKYMNEVEITIEEHIRSTINRALSAYFSIEKNYKAMYASRENYEIVKENYLKGKAPIAQVIDAQNTYLVSRLKASNSQYEFFKELVWVQRAICSVNWAKATKESQAFIEKVKTELEPSGDIAL